MREESLGMKWGGGEGEEGGVSEKGVREVG